MPLPPAQPLSLRDSGCAAGLSSTIHKEVYQLAGTSLLALLDDIATILDDVALMTKVAAKKTAGVLGDDLALNAQQVSGVRADRELLVVWAVAKGSFLNKLILVPVALAVSAFLPWLIAPLLMIGGAFLCYEGCEKLAHKFFHRKEEQAHAAQVRAARQSDVDLVAFERGKIKGAIRTDFILSAEIIVISLGAVQQATFTVQVAAVSAIALLMTLGVYGLVAAIVKLDDGGAYLLRGAGEDMFGRIQAAIGSAILTSAPYLMKTLTVVGTAAMFLVGGGILMHGFAPAHHLQETLLQSSGALRDVGAYQMVLPLLLNAVAGVVAGAVCLAAMKVVRAVTSGMRK